MHYSLRHHLKRLWAEVQNVSLTPKKAQYFIVLSQERTGSTLLTTLLSYHPQILMDTDVFFTPETWPSTHRSGRALFSSRPVRGFKFKGTHTPLKSDAASVQHFLREQEANGLRIIRLQRRNLLRQAISSYMVGLRNDLHAWKDRSTSKQTTKKGSVHVDVEDVVGRMKYFDRLTRFQNQSLEGVPHLTIEYESDLISSERHQTTANRIFNYLGLPSHPVETPMRKLTSNDLSSVVSNVDELTARLQHTPFASYLEAAG